MKMKYYFVALFLLVAPTLILAAQGAPGDSANLKDLIAKAKASSRTVTLALEATEPDVVRGKEKAFEKKFGFPVKLESQPGHHRDMPVKVIESAKSGRGVIDSWDGGTPLILGMFRAGNTRRPPWDAIYEGWPLAKKLRSVVPQIGGGPDGTPHDGQGPSQARRNKQLRREPAADDPRPPAE